jgi:D-inositol-3-phosphate glycosyltransferase
VLRIAVVESAPKGGLLQYAAQLADGLASRGHTVDLVTARDNELIHRDSKQDWGGVGPLPSTGARMHDVLVAAMPNPSEPPTGWRYLVRRARIAVRLVRASARTMWELRRGHYDVAILVDDLNISLAALGALVLVSLPGGPRIAAICHEPRPRNRWAGSEEFYVESGPLYAILSRFYRRLDLVLLHGERSREEFVATWRAKRTAVIPHGDERLVSGEPAPPADEERVLFFGDWRRAKGLPELMRAFEQVEQRRPGARMTIAGMPSPDGDPDAVRAWAAERPATVEVIDRYLDLAEVPALFARSRVVATPYVAGSQSGVVHLAMTAGRAVVASDVGELPQAVGDGVTGRIVPAGDVGALAAALEEVLADKDLAARWGDAGRRRAIEEFGWERVAEQVEAALTGKGV